MSTEFKPSPYQQDIFDFVRAGTESGIIEAVAGSGKTTTIVESLKFISKDKFVLFLAFNKAIATHLDEILKRLRMDNVKAATFHSTGFGAWMNANRDHKIRVEANKVRDLCREWIAEGDLKDYMGFVMKLVGLAKGFGMGYLIPDTGESWHELIDHFDVSLNTDRSGRGSKEVTEERGIELAKMILQKSIEDAEYVIDFDDMLYMPLIKDLRFRQYDYVFVDEAQDTNGVQIALLKRMLKPGGRLIAVGDPYQAIYGFRGADSEAMSRIANEFDCHVLPLSVSYRCPQNVVQAAKEFVPIIEAHEHAPFGVVESLGGFDPTQFTNTDAILCRVTAPLVETAYDLIRRRVACRILGRDIGVGLETLIKQMKARDIDHLEERLDAYAGREIAKLTSKGKEDRAQQVDDKVTTLRTIIGHLPEDERTIDGLIRSIQTLFTDNNKGLLTLSTVHKAKGLEWPRVFILGRDKYMPSPWARKAWQKSQEMNLIYVAYTRAKQELYFLPEGFAKKESKNV